MENIIRYKIDVNILENGSVELMPTPDKDGEYLLYEQSIGILEDNDYEKLIEEYEGIIALYEELIFLLTTKGKLVADENVYEELEKIFSKEDLNAMLEKIQVAEGRHNNKEQLKIIVEKKGEQKRAGRRSV